MTIFSRLLFVMFFMTSFAQADDQVIEKIHTFWFGDLSQAPKYDRSRPSLWFGKNDEVDKTIRTKFGKHVQLAANEKLQSWTSTPEGRLAVILLIDQFTRNIYRGTPQAFASDRLAQRLALEGIAKGDDLKVTPVQRMFFYLPLEHAEDPDLQNQSVTKFTELVESLPKDVQSDYEGSLDYAKRHQVIIERFGRFPHRNEVLGRESTPEEIEFLKTPGSSF